MSRSTTCSYCANVRGARRARWSARNCASTSAMVGFAIRPRCSAGITTSDSDHADRLNFPIVDQHLLSSLPHYHDPRLDVHDINPPGARPRIGPPRRRSDHEVHRNAALPGLLEHVVQVCVTGHRPVHAEDLVEEAPPEPNAVVEDTIAVQGVEGFRVAFKTAGEPSDVAAREVLRHLLGIAERPADARCAPNEQLWRDGQRSARAVEPPLLSRGVEIHQPPSIWI